MPLQSPTAEKIEAARSARARGDSAMVQQLLSQAESLLTPDDLDGLTELWSAISMERMGDFGPEERDRKAGELLERLARAGNVRAQEILMLDYLQGLNGREASFIKFVEWSERAVAGGSLLAAAERKKHGVRGHK
jgi:hypothetical protein